MRRLGDYRNEMRTGRLLDREIEKLLTGAPVEDRSLALLTPLVESLRSSAGHRPQESDVRIFAARAATVVSERSHHHADAVASRRRRAKVGLTPRLAAATLAVLLVPAMAGAALAADSAIPGDPLYGIDRAFEAVGIGAGSTEERLAEAAQLADGGRSQEAIDHALLALQTDGDTTNAVAEEALETAVGQVAGAGVERAEVLALLSYISENVGKGVGADGREFGQGVASLARAIGGGPEDQPNDAQGNGQGQPGSSAPSPAGPPTENPGQGQGNGNGQGNGSGGSPNGNGDPGPPDDTGNDPPTTESDTVAPETGGDDADEANQGNGNGPDPDSPSVTAPGREKKS
jgi:hypothetical protein